MEGLRVKQLEEMTNRGCQQPGCGEHENTLVLAAACHPGKGVDASYAPGSGMIQLHCHVCKAFVCKVKVAEA